MNNTVNRINPTGFGWLLSFAILTLLLFAGCTGNSQHNTHSAADTHTREMLDSARFLLICQPGNAIRMIDSLANVVPQMQNDSLNLILLRIQGEALYYDTRTAEADSVFAIATGMDFAGSETVRADIYTTRAENQNYAGNFEQALVFADSAAWLIRQCENRQDSLLVAYKVALAKGWCHFSLRHYHKMQQHMDEALVLARKLQNRDNELFVYSYLGYFYNEMKNPVKAREYYQKALILGEKAHNYDAILCQLINLAENDLHRNDYTAAIEKVNRAEQINDKWFQARDKSIYIHIIRAKGFLKLKKYADALQNAVIAEQFCIESGDKKGERDVAMMLMNIRMGQKHYDEALLQAQKSLSLTDSTAELRETAEIYDMMARLYAHRGMPDRAMIFMDKEHDITDSLAVKERVQTIHELEVKYQTAEKEQAIEEAALKLKAQKRITQSLAVICVLLLIIGLMIYLYRHRKLQFNRILVLQNKRAAELTDETMFLKSRGTASDGTDGSDSVHNDSTSTAIRRLLDCMEKEKIYLDSQLSLDFLAEHLGLRRATLSELVNKELNKTFSDFVNYYRIEEAKKILELTDYKMEEVCSRAGFGSRQTFNAIFKAFEHMTPSEYRKAVRA